MSAIVGWDLGGANLKLAVLDGVRVVQVVQIPCPLVANRGKFDTAVAEALALCPDGASHAVTMTGELSDVFEDRAEGVAYLVALMRDTVGDAPLQIYGGRAGFLDPDDAAALPMDVASANWHASATLVAALCPDGLFVDMGTTTTDLVPLKGGEPATRGYSDGERLAESELLYTGAVRTPVMAVAREAPFAGRSQRIAAERFATMADVHRLLGALPRDADPYPSADLGGKTTQASAARLARMLGRDADEAGMFDWIDVARHFADAQFAEIEAAAQALLAREALGTDATVIGAGCGRFVAKRLAKELGLAYGEFAELVDRVPDANEMASRAAPAVSVALLSARAYP